MTRFIVLLAVAATAPAILADQCETLSTLALPETTITRAETVEAGSFTLPAAPPAQQASFKRLPAFCRVAAELKPTSDSEIQIEVWIRAGLHVRQQVRQIITVVDLISGALRPDAVLLHRDELPGKSRLRSIG